MTINLHEIFSRCSWRNANSKYMDKIWLQTTSKEYLTNSHILSIYFELAFLQLHLAKISCKLIIIWVNYERNKKGARFFETQCRFTGGSVVLEDISDHLHVLPNNQNLHGTHLQCLQSLLDSEAIAAWILRDLVKIFPYNIYTKNRTSNKQNPQIHSWMLLL